MMARRYEAYRSLVVRPFFRDHFARLDRQIVLVDMLGALNSGPGNKAAFDTYRGKAMLGSRRSQRPFEDQKNLEVKR